MQFIIGCFQSFQMGLVAPQSHADSTSSLYSLLLPVSAWEGSAWSFTLSLNVQEPRATFFPHPVLVYFLLSSIAPQPTPPAHGSTSALAVMDFLTVLLRMEDVPSATSMLRQGPGIAEIMLHRHLDVYLQVHPKGLCGAATDMFNSLAQVGICQLL